MTTSEAIRKLARAGIRIYPIRYYGSFKMVIETSEHPVGIRTSGTQRIGKKLYNAKELPIAQKNLIHTQVEKLKNK
jgi:hypothetical protein